MNHCPPCTGTCRQGRDCPYVGKHDPKPGITPAPFFWVILAALTFWLLVILGFLLWAGKA